MATNFKLDDYSNQLDMIQRMQNNIDDLDGIRRSICFRYYLKLELLKIKE